MREILFRGKRVDNGEWVEGDLIQLHDGRKFIVNNKFGACLDNKGNFINTEAPFVCEVIPETVGQYTGLNANGTKIFEGDIVKTDKFSKPNKQYIVKYDLQFGAFIGQDKDNIYFVSFDGDSDQFEIIGNIHDNEELLEGGVQG